MDENETGIVKKVINDRILVECEASNLCNNCAEHNRCAISGDGKKKEIWIDNVDGVAAGDRILFKVKEVGIINASVLLYVTPIVFLFFGMIVGYKAHSFFNIEIELCSIIFGFGGLIISFVFIKIYSLFILHKERFKPVFIKKLD